MGAYPCIFKVEGEYADSASFYEEFRRVCASDLVTAYEGQDAWTGVRVFDLLGANRIDELPVLRAHLEKIGMEHIAMVNYYNMAPRSVQHEHRDQSGNLLFGISRIHIPLKTNPGAFLEVERKPYHLSANEVWCLDTSGLHAARNDGDEGRVHLVIDIKRAPVTERYFPRTTLAVRLHLAKFVTIMGWKLARDIVTKPATVLDRISFIRRMVGRKLRAAGSR
jgi:hypothetical protein